MKLIIDIPLDLYERCKRGDYELFDDSVRTVAIANGTPLPKGHGRLIDANDVDNHIIGSVDLRDCPTIVEADKENDNE